MGAVEIQEDKVTHFVKQYETINSASVKEFLSSLMEKYTGKKLKIICDQGAYHKSKETKEFINMNNEKIELIYLPPRCPNLNVIERLWKVMRENVTYNKYYHKFKDFAQAVDDFFSSKIYELQHLLVTRLQDNFHIILPNFLTNFS
jgi:transposase